MDCFESTGALGILYAEDFGIEPELPPPSMAAPQPDAPPQLTQADIDAACAEAVQAAEAAWTQSLLLRRVVAVEALAAGLSEARRQAEQQAEAVADGIATTALGIVASMLPHLCREFGDGEVRALLTRLLPTLLRGKQIVVRVHAGLLDALREDFAALDDELIGRVELRPANLPAGDTRLSWEEGSLVRDGAAIRAAIEDGLAQLGLFDPASAMPEKRNLALVQ